MSPRILPGGVSHDSARLRIEGWSGAVVPLTVTPPDGRVEVVAPGRSVPPLADHLIDLHNLTPDTVYEISLAGALPVWIRTAPAQLAGSSGLLLGFTSCYFPSEHFQANPTFVRNALANRDSRTPVPAAAGQPLPKLRTPHAFFLCGDQVYADLGDGPLSFGAATFAEKYRRAWETSRLGSLLGLGGTFFAPDDHELWNGFPERMFYLRATWDGAWEKTAEAAAREVWRQQAIWNFAPGVQGGDAERLGWCYGQLGDVPFFVADLRSNRTGRDGKRRPREKRLGLPPSSGSPKLELFGPVQLDAFTRWMSQLDGLGVLVLPQPLLSQGSRYDGGVTDYPEEQRAVSQLLQRAVLAGNSILLLSGDIHWGRLTSWSPARGGEGRLVEFVSSPVARIGSGLLSLGNLLNERSSVGKPHAVPTVAELTRDEEAPSLRSLFPELRRSYHFASSANQFGLIDLWQAPSERPRARCELFDLNPATKDSRPIVAANTWKPGFSCSFELPL